MRYGCYKSTNCKAFCIYPRVDYVRPAGVVVVFLCSPSTPKQPAKPSSFKTKQFAKPSPLVRQPSPAVGRKRPSSSSVISDRPSKRLRAVSVAKMLPPEKRQSLDSSDASDRDSLESSNGRWNYWEGREALAHTKLDLSHEGLQEADKSVS